MTERRVLYLVNYADYFFSHRLALASAAKGAGWNAAVAVPAVVEEFQERFEKEALPYHELSPINKIYQWPQQISVLIRTIHDYRPDLLHVITLRCTVFWALLAPVFPAQKSLHTIAGFGRLNGKTWHLRLARFLVEIVLYGLARFTKAHFIVQNEIDADYLRDHIIPTERLHLILGSGVDIDLFTPHKRPNDKTLHIGTAARRLKTKGIGEVAKVARACKAQNLPVRFHVAHMPVTEGHPDAVPESQWQAWRDEDLFEDHGHVLDMPGFYAKLDAFLYLSCYGEGLAKTLLEAASAGLPIVTTPRAGCREAVEDGKTGFFVPTGDVQAVVDRILELQADPALRRSMGENGRQRVVDRFADTLIIGQTLSLYDRIVGQ